MGETLNGENSITTRGLSKAPLLMFASHYPTRTWHGITCRRYWMVSAPSHLISSRRRLSPPLSNSISK